MCRDELYKKRVLTRVAIFWTSFFDRVSYRCTTHTKKEDDWVGERFNSLHVLRYRIRELDKGEEMVPVIAGTFNMPTSYH